MSYLLKDNTVVINTKLTSIGRKLLASGSLTFAKYAFGDSEIDYTENNLDDTIDLSESIILSPKDKNPDLRYFVKKSQDSDVLNLLPTIQGKDTLIINTAEERGFFSNFSASTVNIRTTPYYVVNGGTLNLNTTGGNVVTVTNTATFSTISGYTEPIVGDYMMIYYQNNYLSGTTSDGVLNITEPTPILFYKIYAINGTLSGGTATYTLDRPTPNLSAVTSTSSSRVLFFPKGDSINDFYTLDDSTYSSWSENTLSFNGSCNLVNDDVKVWNMSIVFADSVIGTQSTNETYEKYNTFKYKGQLIYLGLDIPAIGIIHYSNRTFSNFYGESFYNNTPVLELPTIMWHGSTNGKLGVKFTCSGTLQIDTNLNTRYYDLADPQGEIVGRVYIDLKIFVITNTDLLIAMSYKGNRNWTLPKPTCDVVESFGGITVEERAFVDPNTQDLHVSYMFVNTANQFGTKGFAYTTGMPYGIYETSTSRTTSEFGFLSFNLNPSKLPFLRSSTQLSGGTGWSANEFKVLVQVTNINEKPKPDEWRIIDITDRLNGYSTWSSTCIPNTAFLPTVPLIIDKDDYDNATLFNINTYIPLPALTNDENDLQFGDEAFFFGNVRTDIEAITYKTKYNLIASINEFNISTNPTWEIGQPVAISEVGIYSTNDELVAISKLNYPIEKKKSDLKIFEISIDF